MQETDVVECQSKLENPELEIPESVRTMCQSDPAGEEQRLLIQRKEWEKHFNNSEQLDFFLLLPLNDEQRHKFVQKLKQ